MTTDALPARALLAPQYRGATLTVSAGIAMHAFNDLSIAASIPIAYEDLGRLWLMPWAYALFYIGVIAGGLISARLRGRFGARTTALAGASCFLFGVLLCCLAPTAEVFAFGRALQGISDGVIVALCYGLIPTLFPKGLVSRVFSAEATVWAIAAVLGPLAGGYATEHLGWRAAMLVCLPLALVFLATVPRSLPRERGHVGPGATASLAPAALCLLGAVFLAGPSALPDRPLAALGLPLGLALVTWALVSDSRRADRFFPPNAFGRGTVGRGTWVLLLMPVAQSVSSVFLAAAIGHTWSLSPVWIGWIVVAMALSWSFSAMWVGGLSATLRWRVLRFGPLAQVLGALLIAYGLTQGFLPVVVLGHSLSGLAFGMVWGPCNQAIMEATSQEEAARTSSFMPTVHTAGYAVGAGLGGWVAGVSGLFPALRAGDASGPIWTLWGAAALVALLALCATLGLRPDRTAGTADLAAPDAAM
ncbi:MFS transporter [Albibacillus kandeliae]|uniref:MFS transporter n=1 Tax=Albibacillus kandeliae TaxID=2174228 RepID=UPI000D687349|nr:MFS transporter [Albibacillus kandeliae]